MRRAAPGSSPCEVRRAPRLARVAGIMGVVQVAGGGANYLVQRVIAGRFGAGPETDAYFLVLGSELVLATTLVGTLTYSFLPVLVRLRATMGEAAFWQAGSALWTRAVTGLVILAASIAAAARLTIRVLAPGFSEAAVAHAAHLLQFSLVGFTLYTGAWVLGVVLQARERFITTALVPVLPLAGALGALLFGPQSHGLYTPLAGFGIGALAILVVQVVTALRMSTRPLPWPKLSSRALRGEGSAVVPNATASVCALLLPTLQRGWASGLAPGSVSALSYAMLLTAIPTAMIFNPVTSVLLPRFAALLHRDPTGALVGVMRRSIALVILVGALAGAVFVALSHEIVRTLLAGASFGSADVDRTASVLSWLGASVGVTALSGLIGQLFCAAGRARLFAATWLVSIPAALLLDLVVVDRMRLAGLGMVVFAAFLLQAAVLLVALHRNVGALSIREIVGLVFRATISAGAVTWVASEGYALTKPLGALLGLGCAALAAATSFALLIWLLRGWEVGALAGRRGRGAPSPPTPGQHRRSSHPSPPPR